MRPVFSTTKRRRAGSRGATTRATGLEKPRATSTSCTCAATSAGGGATGGDVRPEAERQAARLASTVAMTTDNGVRMRLAEIEQQDFRRLRGQERQGGLVAEGDAVSRESLAEHVWDESYEARSNVIDVLVGRLRRKLESAGETGRLRAVTGVGWAFDAPEAGR